MDNLAVKNSSLHSFLESQYDLIEPNLEEFLRDDPVHIPKQFSKKEDIEISAFLTATIAWGQRKTIINNASRLVEMMDYKPHDFIVNHSATDLIPFENFVHRTFNSSDMLFFIHRLKRIYTESNDLESFMISDKTETDFGKILSDFKHHFFDLDFLPRSTKHVADPLKGSTAKRLLMFLRWMVREDLADFGIWKSLKPSELLPPIDIHSAKFARAMGLLHRKQNDWKAVSELGGNLKSLDALDPVKYDYVLYGMGAFSFFRPLSDLRL
jgi:uncharacterized protein (TIGR02757 family)